ncbi:MAG TPA: hypothetical protein P5181_00520 [Dermatophilaceae bacterium]|nr:hypothetical protein [Dermatophilaceae bacterium]
MLSTSPTTGRRLFSGLLASIGLAVGAAATLYIAGAFGLSKTTAANIVRAYEIGGWVLTAALVIFSAGTAAALLAVIRYFITRMTRAALVA